MVLSTFTVDGRLCEYILTGLEGLQQSNPFSVRPKASAMSRMFVHLGVSLVGITKTGSATPSIRGMVQCGVMVVCKCGRVGTVVVG